MRYRTIPTPRLGLPDRLVGVWAHPDDESYLSAGLMARVIEAGGSVTVVTITDGELGFSEDDPRSARERAVHRRGEMHAAMAALGVADVRFVGRPDGGLRFHDATLVAAIAEVLDETDPDLVVTFGPDGATGHPDHIVTSHATTAAWIEHGRGELLYSCETAEWYHRYRSIHDAIGMWMGEEPDGTPLDQIALRLQLESRELDRKRRALAGHSSQTAAVAELLGEETYRCWFQAESFRRPAIHDLVGHVEPNLGSARNGLGRAVVAA